METSDRYASFASREARGESASYEELALHVADDPVLLAMIDDLPENKRQPNLLFAALRYLGGDLGSYSSARRFLLGHWDEVAGTMTTRLTQTNEPGRSAALLPLLATINGPLALLEVGASAGLCLFPDRWHYAYGDYTVGNPADPTLTCTPIGFVPMPERLPEISWRAGLDLNPLDVSNPDDVRWLQCLIWPEQFERRTRLEAAVRIARSDPPLLMRGNLLTDLPALVAQSPADATLVVFHTAVLTYVPVEQRQQFVDQVAAMPGHWISNEGPGVFPQFTAGLSGPEEESARFLVALDGQALAWSGPHGQSIQWLAEQKQS